MVDTLHFRAVVPSQYRLRAAVNVTVHPNLKSLAAEFKLVKAAGSSSKGLQGFATTYEIRSPTGRKLPLLGEIHLTRSTCTIDVIVHEVMHVVFAWLRYKPERLALLCDPNQSDAEEDVCYVLGGLAANVVRQLLKNDIKVL